MQHVETYSQLGTKIHGKYAFECVNCLTCILLSFID